MFRLLPALLLCAASSALAGGGHGLTVSAVVVSNNNCRFLTAASTLNLGAIDPSGTAAVSASANIRVRCTGSGLFAMWGISNNSGLYGLGANALRMRHATDTGEHLAYSLSYPQTGTIFWGVPRTITVAATVAAADYQNARPGAYSDTVVLSLLP
jgi:spore coat protein U-like protein